MLFKYVDSQENKPRAKSSRFSSKAGYARCLIPHFPGKKMFSPSTTLSFRSSPAYARPCSWDHSRLFIKDGYGELILRIKKKNSWRPLTLKEYTSAYPLFQKYVPSLSNEPRKIKKSRIACMREELVKVHPRLVATFIPRTLYDLFFIRESIEADRNKPEGSSYSTASNAWSAKDPIGFRPVQIIGPQDVTPYAPALIKIGYKLNVAGCAVLPKQKHLRIDQIQNLVNEHMHFLKSHCESLESQRFICYSEGWPSISGNFAAHFSRGMIQSMAVNSEKIVRLIQQVTALECRPSSIGKIIAFRGGDISEDAPLKQDGRPYSMSFGSSLFSGVVSDASACPYFYMRQRISSYAFVLDPAMVSSNIFFVPPFTALESLFGRGEAWHLRFKISEKEEGKIAGFDGGIGLIEGQERYTPFKSPFTREELIAQFEALKKDSLVLF